MEGARQGKEEAMNRCERDSDRKGGRYIGEGRNRENRDSKKNGRESE